METKARIASEHALEQISGARPHHSNIVHHVRRLLSKHRRLLHSLFALAVQLLEEVRLWIPRIAFQTER